MLNQASNGAPTAIQCSATLFTIANNIVYDNGHAAGANPKIHKQGNCVVKSNIIGPGSPIANNMDIDPQLVDEPDDLQLKASSPARGAADPLVPLAGLTATDFWGDPRPNPAGQQADLGADEAP